MRALFVSLVLLSVLIRPGLFAADSAELASLREKAERGNAVAQYNLGLAYAQGRDAPLDRPEAYAWLSLAAEKGTTGKALESLLSTLTPAQLAEGEQRLAQHRADVASVKPSRATAPALKSGTPQFSHPSSALASSPAPLAPVMPTERSAPAAVPTLAEVMRGSEPVGPAIGKVSDNSIPAAALAQTQKELDAARAQLATLNIDLQRLQAQVNRLEAAAKAAREPAVSSK